MKRTLRRPSFQIRVEKGRKGEEVVFGYLKSQGIPYHQFKHPSEVTDRELSSELKRFFRDYPYLKVDALINFKREPCFIDVKTKKNEIFWVNKEDYKGYYELSRLMTFLIYFYIQSSKTLFVHKVTEPIGFKTKEDRSTEWKPVYMIPKNLIEKVVSF